MMETNRVSEIQEFFSEYLNGYSKKTIYDYLYWFDRFPQAEFLDADEEEAQRIINRFINRLDSSNKRGFLLAYLKCFDLKQYSLPERKRVTKKIIIKNALSLQEIEILREAMYKKGMNQGMAFSMIYECGLRGSELNSVKWKSLLDIANWMNGDRENIVVVVKGKGNKERYVLLSSKTLIRHLQNLKYKHCLSQPQLQNLIANAKNEEMTIIKCKQKWFYKNLTKVSKRALGRNVYPHLLRHSRATHLLDLGAEVKDIQNYLGHAKLDTTEVYLHRDKKKSLANIDKLIKE